MSVRRSLIVHNLIDYAKSNPSTVFYTLQRKNKHPFIKATYLNGYTKQIGVKNKQPSEISAHLDYLKNTTGFKIKHRVNNFRGNDGLHFKRTNSNRGTIGAVNDPLGRQLDGRQDPIRLTNKYKQFAKSGGVPDHLFTHDSWYGMPSSFGLEKPIDFDQVNREFRKLIPGIEASKSSKKSQRDVPLPFGIETIPSNSPELEELAEWEPPLYPSQIKFENEKLVKMGESILDDPNE